MFTKQTNVYKSFTNTLSLQNKTKLNVYRQVMFTKQMFTSTLCLQNKFTDTLYLQNKTKQHKTKCL